MIFFSKSMNNYNRIMIFCGYIFKNGKDIDDAIIDGFYIDKRDSINDNIYSRATYEGKLDLVKYLDDNKEKYPELDFKVVDKYGNDVLCASAMGGHINVFEYLLEHNKLDIKVKNKFGSSVYHLAAMNNHVHFLEYLEKKYKWYIYEKSDNGTTAYIFAAHYGKLNVIKYFENKKDFDIHHTNNLHECAYHISHTFEIMKHFENKTDFNIHVENKYGAKKYHIDAFKGNKKSMRYLEDKYGFDGKYLDGNGSTVYHSAVKSGKLNHVKYVEKYVKNLNPYLKNNYGETVYDIASKKEFKEILEHFRAKNYIFSQDNIANKVGSKLEKIKNQIQRKKDLIIQYKKELAIYVEKQNNLINKTDKELKESELKFEKCKASIKAIAGDISG